MNFVENIYQQLKQSSWSVVLREVHDGGFTNATGAELLQAIGKARGFIRRAGLKKGDRCGLLASNSIRWAVLDVALMAEGVIVVPLYSRQAPAELVNMLRDCGASMVCCENSTLRDGIASNWTEGAPPLPVFDEILGDETNPDSNPDTKVDTDAPIALDDTDIATIIYTSGTSGEPKGVMLSIGNVGYMLGCTGYRLGQLMAGSTESTPDQVFHYLPFCFAGSWILMLNCLTRNATLSISMDLNKLADELSRSAPNYFLNVPTLLERIRTGVESQIAQKPGFVQSIYRNGKESWVRRREGRAGMIDSLQFRLARWLIFASIRKKIGSDIKALICGSAPLAKETQMFFMMLGIRVLQVYGLTETTAICTMDDPGDYTPGRVGPAIPGIEMKLGENEEIIVRGPNIFPGYWNRPEATANTIVDGWFHTGDQGEVDAKGNWMIIGRLKNLLILNSGHNVAPEPIEEKIALHMPTAQQVVVMGNDRSFLTALVTGDVSNEQVDAAIQSVNSDLPHYKRVIGYHINKEPLTIESGLLTANGKLKRDAIASHFFEEIEAIYRSRKS
ncbi:MAG: AMP-binding protein [Acidobacteria bacterium]|nr:AMP-binding protein [Acidobacteriota bacterium]